MAYTIYKSDGTAVTIPDNTIDTSNYDAGGGGGFGPGNVPQSGYGLGIQFIGRNAVDYGAPIAQNFLQLQENFSSSTVPSDLTSVQGQLWFQQTSTTTGSLFVRVTTNTTGGIANWQQLLTVSSGGGTVVTVNPSTPSDGDIKVVSGVISIYANSTWNQVFPAVYS